MSDMIPNNPLMKIMDASKWNWVQLILSLPVVFLRVGCFSFGLINLLLLGINMFTLIGIGGVAFYLVWLGCFSCCFLMNSKLITERFLYFEATTVILTLVLLGQLLEARAHSQTSGAIKNC
jgi:Cu2+-exporting ATPase